MPIELRLEQTINADAVLINGQVYLHSQILSLQDRDRCSHYLRISVVSHLENLDLNRKDDASASLQVSKQRKIEEHWIPYLLI